MRVTCTRASSDDLMSCCSAVFVEMSEPLCIPSSNESLPHHCKVLHACEPRLRGRASATACGAVGDVNWVLSAACRDSCGLFICRCDVCMNVV